MKTIQIDPVFAEPGPTTRSRTLDERKHNHSSQVNRMVCNPYDALFSSFAAVWCLQCMSYHSCTKLTTVQSVNLWKIVIKKMRHKQHCLEEFENICCKKFKISTSSFLLSTGKQARRVAKSRSTYLSSGQDLESHGSRYHCHIRFELSRVVYCNLFDLSVISLGGPAAKLCTSLCSSWTLHSFTINPTNDQVGVIRSNNPWALSFWQSINDGKAEWPHLKDSCWTGRTLFWYQCNRF